MNISRLDGLPVELIHHLLCYFSAHEIFSTFHHVTPYIDSILASYTSYRINFKAISRNHFDLVCQHILPDQVIALTLSDDEDTPGLIDLFLARFQIQQFIHLRGLKLIDIGPDFWASIITQIVTLKHLQSFLYCISNDNISWISSLTATEITQLDKSLFNTYALILPQLYELGLSHDRFLSSITFSHLRHLILSQSSINFIQEISSAAPHLETLDTSLVLSRLPTDWLWPMSKLNRLTLEITGLVLSINAFEQMISNMPCLEHLKLNASCSNDVIDGEGWKTITKNLVTFKFRFSIVSEIEADKLDSFRTLFWTTMKRWFVAYINKQFYSVSQSTITEMDSNFQLPKYTTLPDLNTFYQGIHKLVLSKNSEYLNHHFPNVHKLILRDSPSFSAIKDTVDLRQIRNLTVYAFNRNFPIVSLINEMTNLCQISIRFDNVNFLMLVHPQILKKIQTVRIGRYSSYRKVKNKKIENLFVSFPYLKHFHLRYSCSFEEIYDCLRGFKHLSTASFSCIDLSNEIDAKQHRLNLQSRLDQMRHKEGLNFTYRFARLKIYFWIGSHANDHQT